jgi:hypothetical protein
VERRCLRRPIARPRRAGAAAADRHALAVRASADAALGLSRTLQWGGEGRNESLKSLANALIGRDNVGADGLRREDEPGNQLAGVDWRWRLGAAPDVASFYGQVVGEDEAGMAPSRNMVLLGADMAGPGRLGASRVFVEAVDTIAGDVSGNDAPGAAYRHHAFAQGYTHRGRLLGHPLDGDVRALGLGVQRARGPLTAMAALTVGRAEATAQTLRRRRAARADRRSDLGARSGAAAGRRAVVVA